jgi:hypothetical protein
MISSSADARTHMEDDTQVTGQEFKPRSRPLDPSSSTCRLLPNGSMIEDPAAQNPSPREAEEQTPSEQVSGEGNPVATDPLPRGAAAHPLWRTPAGRRIYLTPSRETQAHQVGLLSGGRRPSRKNRAGDCGDTNASRARANPHFRPYALWRAVPFGYRNFRRGVGC